MTLEQWLNHNQLSIDIWNKKYRYNQETFDEWLDRVSGGNSYIRRLILEKKFLFGGRILANRGIQKINPEIKTTYSNCYVLSAPEDNLESIFSCNSKLARTFSYGGGVGIDLSKLAPAGAKVRNAAKESSGAVSFMDLFSLTTGLISQNGRRGALMISMACNHPDIEEFIDIKKDLSRVTKANISVRAFDSFMQAAEKDQPYDLYFARSETGETIRKTVRAKDLLMRLAYNNWDMGEPGILFWNRISNWNLLSGYSDFEYAGTNPCAEEPLPAGGSCLLSSINLSEYVGKDGLVDLNALDRDVYEIVKAMNDVLDEGLELHPLQEQRDSARDWRQIGIGVMGVADMLIKCGIRYGSDEAIALCSHISNRILNNALLASSMLAKQNGHPFPKFRYEALANSEFYATNVSAKADDAIRQYGLYNSQLLTIAPTGTLSTMLGISGGLEPIFANSYTRKTESLHGKDEYYKVYTPIVQQYMDAHGLSNEEDLPDFFVTAKDLDHEERIRMQAAWQNHIDASISSTINLPYDATPEDVYAIYVKAWQCGLKGITVFRDGCRRASILSTAPKAENPAPNAPAAYGDLPRGFILNASDNVVGKKRKLVTGCGTLHVTAFFDPLTADLMETYLSKGSTGGCNNFMIGLSRMISLAARAGCDVSDIVDQLDSCGVCPSYAVRRATQHDTSKGSCCPMAVGNALMDMWAEMKQEVSCAEEFPDSESESSPPEEQSEKPSEQCPECKSPLVHEGGCDVCKNCGWSKCG